MNGDNIKTGMKVQIGKLNDTAGMLIHARHLICRRSEVKGTVEGYVPGHGGDVWWVKHENSDVVGAYSILEMEPCT